MPRAELERLQEARLMHMLSFAYEKAPLVRELWDAIKLTDIGISHLAGLPRLQKVHISNGLIGDGSLAVFAKMPSIQELSLQGNNFSDAGLKHLAGMTQLRSLWVGMSKLPITDAGVRHLAGLTSL